MKRFALAALLVPAALAAQVPGPTYARTPGDTLRFREWTSSTITVNGPTGETRRTIEHRGVVALSFEAPDLARAWYEELSLTGTGPQGAVAPSTDGMLRQPFLLDINPRGRILTLHAPTVPPGVRALADLARHFDDYLIPLPAAPLRRGLVWADTVRTPEGPGSGAGPRELRISRYQVEGDTAVDGTRAQLIRYEVTRTVQQRIPTAVEGRAAGLEITSRETGSAYFSPALGRMVGRDRHGVFDGSTTVAGAAGLVQIKQRFEYTNKVRLAR